MNQTNSNTLRLTFGAMILAIFTLLLLLNRQTGGFFDELFIYILPVPMVIYAAKYGWKSGVWLFFGMAVFSFFFGTPYTMFYAVTAALLGLFLGTRFYKGRDMTRTLLMTMGLSALFELISIVNYMRTIILWLD